ncbi:acetate/propionate family kinase [Demequina zhanjiangensis]|uniref:Acetate kinase n=1 Tax=Demequina zhanjiangensis TaxID=3051659 RepID=A0ABT8FXE6_9MICO|nr:acetate kinase [Demequina sp. SYSU T00b26]MDN4471578.1 acetate kinase [Demequina sp. SYSU T00b26]
MAVNYEGIALVLNCGSSSVKYQVVDTTKEEPLASGIVERVTDHAVAIQEIIATLGEPGSGVDLGALTVVGHRVVQGGEEFSAPTIIDDDVERGIAKLSVLAPLHNPGHVAGISAARSAFPQIPHVAVFDTAFHTTLPEEAYTYPLDIRVAKEHGIRKYGFHGTSHGYVSREAARLMGKDPKDVNIITLHLGNGASADAVQAGRAVDTSMGLTPLDGLMMGSRTGTIDPAVVFHLHRAAGMSIDEIDTLFNKQSGLLGMCGYSDLRDVHKAIEAGSHEARLALDVYTRRIKMYVGQYLAVMGAVDAIVFTAGVGENDDIVRLESMKGLEGLGIKIDEERNAGRKKQAALVSSDDSAVQIWVVPTNEEREIALQSIAAVS